MKYELRLGKGSTKNVFKALDTKTYKYVAWNEIYIPIKDREKGKKIILEIDLIEKLKSPYTMNFIGSWADKTTRMMYFITELAEYTLREWLNKYHDKISIEKRKNYAYSILKGIEYLHSKGVIHRDLKSENVFITFDDECPRIFIGDFGISSIKTKTTSAVGTPEFMALEMYEGDEYTNKVDMYAFGCILLELFTNNIPYMECDTPVCIYKKVSKGILPLSYHLIKDPELKNIIKRLLSKNPDDRPSAEELLKEGYFKPC